MSAAGTFVHELLNTWGNNSIFVDASTLPLSPSGRAAIRAIANRGRSAGANIIPATPLGALPAYLQEVNAVAVRDGRGVGLRVDLQELTSAAVWAGNWIRPLTETDLIADFEDEIQHVAALGNMVDQAFNGLHQGQQWRTVTMAGTSIPPTFTGYPQGVQTIRREEWHLWRRLSQNVTRYSLDYGDYATVNPNAPVPPGPVSFPINAKYTLQDDFLICRGVSTSGPGSQPRNAQFIQHAQTIRAYPTRGPLAHC
jgi:hypothetical protein